MDTIVSSGEHYTPEDSILLSMIGCIMHAYIISPLHTYVQVQDIL